MHPLMEQSASWPVAYQEAWQAAYQQGDSCIAFNRARGRGRDSGRGLRGLGGSLLCDTRLVVAARLIIDRFDLRVYIMT